MLDLPLDAIWYENKIETDFYRLYLILDLCNYLPTCNIRIRWRKKLLTKGFWRKTWHILYIILSKALSIIVKMNWSFSIVKMHWSFSINMKDLTDRLDGKLSANQSRLWCPIELQRITLFAAQAVIWPFYFFPQKKKKKDMFIIAITFVPSSYSPSFLG